MKLLAQIAPLLIQAVSSLMDCSCEALSDVISQFESQGVNLSNIVKRVPGADAADDPAELPRIRFSNDAAPPDLPTEVASSALGAMLWGAL